MVKKKREEAEKIRKKLGEKIRGTFSNLNKKTGKVVENFRKVSSNKLHTPKQTSE